MATAAPPPGGTTMMVVDHSVANNGAYTGRLVDNQRDGKGTCTWQNGQTFYGDWKYDNMHGRGMYTWLDGDSHTGEWRNDKRDGWGVSRRADGWSFEGLFRDDSWKRGSWHSPAKAYEGEWAWNEAASEHQLHGWGVQRGTQPNENALMMETVYEGEWDRGQWHGSGTWRSPDGSGDMYHGVFEHGKRSGNGRMLFGGENSHGGGSYVGEWKDDKFHGLGVRLWANGDRYVGQWLCGKENGEGAMRWACDGSSFDGVWEGGAVRSGTMKWPNGDQFSGTFRGDGVGEGIATVKSCDSSTTSKFEGTVTSGIFQEHGNGGVRHHMGCGDLLMEEELRKLKTEKTIIQQKLDEQCMRAHIKEKSELEARLKEEMAISKMEPEEVAKRNNQLHVDEPNQLHKIQQQEQLEGKGDSLLIPTTVKFSVESNDDETTVETQEKAKLELNQAMKLTTQFQALLKKSAPEFILLRESLAKSTKHLQGATQCNEALRSHLRDLNELKDLLEKQLDETCETSKRALGQTLTVQNSEAEIQQCSRSISDLTKKVLATKHTAAGGETTTEGEKVVIPPTKGSELLMVTLSEPLVLNKIAEAIHLDATSGLPQPFQWLGSLSDTLGELQGCRFEECTKLADQKTMLSKELSEQITVGLNLHKQIEEIKGVCTMMTQEHKTKWMLMRGLEGDEQFMAMPCVWSMLSELLPQAQQAVVDLVVSKAASMAAVVSPPSMRAVTTSTLPGCTSTALSSSAGVTAAPTTIVNKLCIECDENTANVQFQPCGHIVLCSQCATTVVGMRKCLVCRTPIHQKNLL